MPKEIATKTNNGFTPTPKDFGVGARYKCLPVQILNGKICSGTACLPAKALAKEGEDEIFWNTHKKLSECKCKAIYVNGCEDYIRIGGNEGDYEVVHK